MTSAAKTLARETDRRYQTVRLVFFIRTLAIGGAERQLVGLAKSLDKKKFDVTVLTLYGSGDLGVELIRAGVRTISLNKKGRWDLASVSLPLIRVLRQLNPDILHSYLTGQNVLAAIAKMALPETRIVWGVRASNVNDHRRDWLARVNSRAEMWLSSLPDLTIFNSVAGRDHYFAAGFAGHRWVVIPNGIDTQRFAPDRNTGLKCRSSWGIPHGSLLIGIVGRLDRIKDHETFLRGAAIFANRRSEARFVCIGSGPDDYLSELRQLVARLNLTDRVTWSGLLTDMVSAYNALDICCSSSFGEGLSNAIAEAMACGVPCVVTDVGDSALAVGDTGVVVPRRNPEALAAGWSALADRMNQNPSLGDAARERIKSRFTMSALISNTTEALLAIL